MREQFPKPGFKTLELFKLNPERVDPGKQIRDGLSDLVDFDGAVNLADEPIASQEADGAGEEKNDDRHDEGVPKVEDTGCDALQCKL